MKVLMLNGSPHPKGCTYTALMAVSDALQKENVETEMLYLGKEAVPSCIACGQCDKTGRCFRKDGVNDILDRLEEFDALVVGSPVYYAAASGQITSFLNRLFYAGRGRFAHMLGASVVSCRRAGETSAFDQLNKYFTISGMSIVGSMYWNQVHGNTPEEVRQDTEGMESLRVLGENMAWLLKCMEAGRAAGIPVPNNSEITNTNFIR